MVVKSANAASIDTSDANIVQASRYLVVNPTGSGISTSFNSNSVDVDGAVIANGTSYKCFILSVADGISADINALSSSSNAISLTTVVAPTTVADTSYNILISDVADNQHAADMEISFTPATNENTIGEYRVMIVKSSASSGFDTTAAQNVGAGNYHTVSPNGSPHSFTLTPWFSDVHGDTIVEGVEYVAFVMNMADGNDATLNSLSGPSNPLILTSHPSGIDEISESDIEIFQNEVSLLIGFFNPDEQNSVALIDMNGRILWESKTSVRQVIIPKSSLNPGIYSLQRLGSTTLVLKIWVW